MNRNELAAIRALWDEYRVSQSEQHGELEMVPVSIGLLDSKLTKVFATVVELESDLDVVTRERDSLARRCAQYFQEAEEMRAQIHVLKGHEVPDVNAMDRGFGNCPHCRSPRVTRCHECLNEIFRDEAHAAGWRMDHLSGFGCIALCPDHK